MTRSPSPRPRRLRAAWLTFSTALVLSACALPASRTAVQQTYRLGAAEVRSAALPHPVVLQLLSAEPAPGFGSPAMMYSRQPDLLAPYRDSRWLAPPQRMIDDAIAGTFGRQPWIAGVQRQFTLVRPDFTLQCALGRLEHDIAASGGTVRLDLDCQLVDDASHRIAGRWNLDGAQPIPVDDAAHFAQAAQTLLDRALDRLVASTRNAVAQAQATRASP